MWLVLEGFLASLLGVLIVQVRLAQISADERRLPQITAGLDRFCGLAEKWSECLLDLPESLEDVPSCVLGVF